MRIILSYHNLVYLMRDVHTMFHGQSKMSPIFQTKGGIVVDSLKVSSRSNPNSVAGALVAVIREQGYAEMQAVGAGALNQAVKAIAIARGFVAPSGTDLTCSPAFTDILIAGEDRTALKLLVEKRGR